MTKLIKNRNTIYIPGTLGQPEVKAVPSTPGYYTTIQVSTLELVPKPVPIVPKPVEDDAYEYSFDSRFDNGKGVSWRIATYAEILKTFYSFFAKPSKCEVAERILELISTTATLFQPLGYPRSNTNSIFLAIVSIEGQQGICYVTTTGLYAKLDWASLKKDNPSFRKGWVFSDYYSCEEVNGVEQVTAL